MVKPWDCGYLFLGEENKSMNAHVSSVYFRMQRIAFRDMKSQ